MKLDLESHPQSKLGHLEVEVKLDDLVEVELEELVNVALDKFVIEVVVKADKEDEVEEVEVEVEEVAVKV